MDDIVQNDTDAKWVIDSHSTEKFSGRNLLTPAPIDSNELENELNVYKNLSSEDSVFDGRNHKCFKGNQLIHLPPLLSGLHKIASCRICAEENFEHHIDKSIAYCNMQKNKEEQETRHRPPAK